MKFAKYQALGNDYIVLPPAEAAPTPDRVRQICDRHYGVGSDGLLLGPLPTGEADFGLRLFNPDGNEFEKSGNGLRIFARYLWDCGFVGLEPFTVSTPGGRVTCRVDPGGGMVTVEMGRVSFHSRDIPVNGPDREVLDEVLQIEGAEFRYCAATLGNPHCVLLRKETSEQEARTWGPLIERERRFPNRTNVQFMQVLDRRNIRIEIWERGAGYTLASGSSSCAAAAAAHRLGLCEAEVSVHVPGGNLHVSLSADFRATLRGPVARICAGELADGADS
jgi:diaminopimelate epimerase